MVNVGKMLEKAATNAVQSLMNRAARKVVSGAVDLGMRQIQGPPPKETRMVSRGGVEYHLVGPPVIVDDSNDCELTVGFFLTPGTSRGLASRAFNICHTYKVMTASVLSETEPAWFTRTHGVGELTAETMYKALVQAGYENSKFCRSWERSRAVVVTGK